MARRTVNVFSLSFLDAMTCGFGAVVLFYMVINSAVGLRTQEVTADRQAEVDLLEEEVLEGFKDLVEVRNSVREAEEEIGGRLPPHACQAVTAGRIAMAAQ